MVKTDCTVGIKCFFGFSPSISCISSHSSIQITLFQALSFIPSLLIRPSRLLLLF